MESYIVHFDRRPYAKESSEPMGIVEDMQNRLQNSFSNTQELMLLLGQFDSREYPWQERPARKRAIIARVR